MSSILKTSLNFSKIVLGTTLMYLPGIFSRNGYTATIIIVVLLGGVFSTITQYLLFEVYYRRRIEKSNKSMDSISNDNTVDNDMFEQESIANSDTGSNFIGDFECLSFELFGKLVYAYTYVGIFLISLICILYYIEMILKMLDICKVSNKKVVLMMLLICVNLFFNKFNQLEFANYIGLCVVFILACTTFMECLKNSQNVIHQFVKNDNILSDISLIALSFCSHYCIVLPNWSSGSKHGLKGNYNRILNIITLSISCFISIFTYIFIGYTGYKAYPNCGLIWIESISDSYKQALAVIFIAITLLGFPLCFIDLRVRFEKICGVFINFFALKRRLSNLKSSNEADQNCDEQGANSDTNSVIEKIQIAEISENVITSRKNLVDQKPANNSLDSNAVAYKHNIESLLASSTHRHSILPTATFLVSLLVFISEVIMLTTIVIVVHHYLIFSRFISPLISFVCSTIMFCIPSAMYLKVFGLKKFESFLSFISMVFGGLLCYKAVKDLIQ